MKLSCLQKSFKISFNCFLYTLNSNSMYKENTCAELTIKNNNVLWMISWKQEKKKNLIETRFVFLLFVFIFNCVIFFVCLAKKCGAWKSKWRLKVCTTKILVQYAVLGSIRLKWPWRRTARTLDMKTNLL